MKKIIYTRPDGGLSIITPVEGARLALSVTLADQKITSDRPVPVDLFLRRWPVSGAVVEWAETEDEFVARIAAKDVPAGLAFQIVSADKFPADRTNRNKWKANIGSVSEK